MAEITAALVKSLREQTGAGMMDCKKALTETAGDVEAAIDWLRKKGLAAAAKKAGRTASEGLVGIATAGTVGAVVEVNAETDFVARNDTFQGFVEAVASLALTAKGDIEALKSAVYPGGEGRTVEAQVTHLIATIGENMQLRRSAALEVEQGVVTSYMHTAVKPGLGKIGVLVALKSAADPAKLEELGRQIAMHVAAAQPRYAFIAEVDAEALDRERAVLSEQAKASGKPEAIIEKMVEGRLRKFYEEVVLTEQIFVIDGETKIAKVLEKAGKDLGAPIELGGFVRFQLGEGIEKEESDFAAEVAAQLKK
ncbi:elongation factor Ts [Rhodospirillum rubrum]|uniref:translation elongation factor Ts n=1 Tax=Rhodospirillum rubrum TaxID=1085 RepID=UPI0019089318|nr:translation elongation factor Ts [Rhodospirillum rubrum]MBK1663293.1 elongation factor Ts [Rhodospirillum rubrum]MBK1675104.1 elongation factor Ts [Rhodospirillum rubrum]